MERRRLWGSRRGSPGRSVSPASDTASDGGLSGAGLVFWGVLFGASGYSLRGEGWLYARAFPDNREQRLVARGQGGGKTAVRAHEVGGEGSER